MHRAAHRAPRNPNRLPRIRRPPSKETLRDTEQLMPVRNRLGSVALGAFEYAFCPLVLGTSISVTWLAGRHGIGWVQTLFFSSVAPVALVTFAEWVHPYREDWNSPFRANR